MKTVLVFPPSFNRCKTLLKCTQINSTLSLSPSARRLCPLVGPRSPLDPISSPHRQHRPPWAFLHRLPVWSRNSNPSTQSLIKVWFVQHLAGHEAGGAGLAHAQWWEPLTTFSSPEAAIRFRQHQGSRPLTGPDFWRMLKVLVWHFQPIRFARFYNESVNRGLPVLEPARGLNPWCWQEGSRPLGTRMLSPMCSGRVRSQT